MIPDPASVLRPTVTEWGASRYGEYRRCHKAHHLKFHLRVRPAPRKPLENPLEATEADGKLNYFDVGKLVAASHQWMREGVLAGESAPRDWAAPLMHAPLHGYALPEIDEASRLLGAYFMHYGPENAGFPEGSRILAVEHEMRAPEGSRIFPYTARADAILQLPSGEIVIVDDKTRAQAFPQNREWYAQGAATRPQFCGLSWLLRAEQPCRACGGIYEHADCCDGDLESGSPPPAVWINGIIKTKIPKFDRVLVTMTHAGLARWEEAQAADAAIGCTHANPNYNSCAPEIGSRCWAFEWCHGSESARRERFVVGDEAAPTEEGEQDE